MLFTMYFLCNEIKQLGNQSIIAFISNMWNIIDVIPLILVTTSVVITFINPENALNALIWQRYLNAISVFFLWIKLLYFCRIYRAFSSLINLMQGVITDIQTFLIILVLTMFAFAGTFYILSQNNEPEDRFVTSWFDALKMMFELAVGNFDSSSFGKVGTTLVYVFFMLGAVFLLIMMMNLLIAIIGDTFGQVQDKMEVTMYQEFISLILENLHLVSAKDMAKMETVGNYLCITSLDNNEMDLSELQVARQRLGSAVKKLKDETIKKSDQLIESFEQSQATCDQIEQHISHKVNDG